MHNSPRARKIRKVSYNDHVDAEQLSDQKVTNARAKGKLRRPSKPGVRGFNEEEPEAISSHAQSNFPCCSTRSMTDDINQAAEDIEFSPNATNGAVTNQKMRLAEGHLQGGVNLEETDDVLRHAETARRNAFDRKERHATAKGKDTRKGRGDRAREAQECEECNDSPSTRSSTRQRRQPQRLSLEIDGMTSSPSSRKARQFRGTARTAIPVAAESLSSADLSRGSTNANTSVSLSKMPLKRKQDVSLEVVSGTLAVAEPMRWKKTHDKRTGHGIPQQRAMLSRKVQTSPQSGRPPDHNDCIEDERLEDERLEDERLEAERLEAERLEAERLKAERLEDERSEDERSENANLTPIERNLFEDSISNRISKRERPDAGNHEDRQQQSQRQFSISIVRYRCSHRSASSRIATTPSVEALLGDEELDMLSTAETLLPSSRSKQAETGKGLGVTSQFELLKKVVLEKLTGRRPIPLTGLDDEHDKVHHLLEQTVTAGEGNSMLIIGARGTGKTTLVNAVLGEIAAKHREHFHVVRLNGFVQTDDKLALREIWRQLGREMEVEEEGQTKNYADTLTTLLALLSHPSELSGAEPDQIATSVIFIMDEFDLFAGHPRQTLLYNFFDIAQSRKAPIAVLGLTTRVDVAESLEKRVKSRFSHRYIHIGLPKNFMAFQHICKTALQLQAEELDFQERAQLCSPAGTAKNNLDFKMNGDCIAAWNASIEILFKSAPLIQHLSYIYHTSKSIPTLLTTFLLPVSLLTPTSRHLTPTSICSESNLEPPDSKLHLLPCLPTVALALLIAAARLDVILDIDTCNFDMAYEEYSTLVAKARVTASTGGRGGVGVGITARVWGKEVARGMWEKLVDLELLLPVVGAGGSGLRQGEMVRCDVALEELEGAMEGHLERGLQKWCREI